MLDKRYEFAEVEQRFSEAWERDGCYAAVLDGREPFAIMMPPPNVTGTLHLGHAMDNTLPDILVRRARMQGKAALYQPGTDHASIAVHVVLERAWAKEGKTRFDYGREKFLEKAWEWKDYSAGAITGQLRKLGISCDWNNERFTMDPAYVTAVNKAFITLYERGLIYRGQRLVNWDPKMQTAVSDLEVKHQEINGNLWHVRYKFADGKDYKGVDGIEIATTRPETILADGAIAIHPDDPRAADLVGRKVLVPLVHRAIEIVADTMVDPEFGSGMVKITAAHDFNDFEFYKRHKADVDVPLINLLNPDGTMNANCPEAYVGMDRFAARKKIVADLDAAGQLIKVEPHTHNVGHAERDDTILEPYLTWQWYVLAEPIARKCLAAAAKGDVKFVNDRDYRVYRNWLENTQDWCISRQLWWGHRIPAWFRDVPGTSEPEIFVGEEAPKGEGWAQDPDILDTWFSSALWPFATQGWPQEGERLHEFFPGAVVMNGRDILPFWDVRMLMMSLELMGTVPFRTVYTHGLILDEHGQKMSKSKGNVVDPLELMQTYGTDALRLTMASITSSEDMRFSIGKVEQNRNFCTKLWNAARFMQMQDVRFGAEDMKAFKHSAVQHPVNRWLVGELKELVGQVDEFLDAYQFNQAAQAVYHFTWGVWCDWYLELTKPLLAEGADKATADETRLVMGWAFDQLLRVLHPFIPFVTEAIWQQHTLGEGSYLMVQTWPKASSWPTDEAVRTEMAQLVELIGAIRQTRMLHKLPNKAMLKLHVHEKNTLVLGGLKKHAGFLEALAGVDAVIARTTPAGAGEAVLVVGGVEYILPLAGLIDLHAERARLVKEKDKQSEEKQKLESLLGNDSFVARAPLEVVAQNRERVAELAANISKLQAMLDGPYAG